MWRDDYEAFLKALAKKREPAMREARELVAQQQFDEAEREVRSVDDSIYGMVALGKLYRERLEELVQQGVLNSDRAQVEAIFRRARDWAFRAYPEIHTQDEADSQERGQANDLSKLVAILGYDPDAK